MEKMSCIDSFDLLPIRWNWIMQHLCDARDMNNEWDGSILTFNLSMGFTFVSSKSYGYIKFLSSDFCSCQLATSNWWLLAIFLFIEALTFQYD